MPNIVALRESDWKKDDGTTVKVSHLTLDDGREIPGYDLPPGAEAGKPLPEGWEVALSKAGKPYIKVPKARKEGSGFSVAFRNTREGQAVEQERMDRRTALMQAVALHGPVPTFAEQARHDLLFVAGGFYDWLRATAGVASPPPPAGVSPPSGAAPAGTTSAGTRGGATAGEQSKADWGQSEATGEGVTGPPVGCAHKNTSPLGPTGRAVPAGKVFCLECRTVIKEA